MIAGRESRRVAEQGRRPGVWHRPQGPALQTADHVAGSGSPVGRPLICLSTLLDELRLR
jgi:hypothetical protein